MAIVDGLKTVTREYLAAKTQPLRGHPLAALIRDTLPQEISEEINRGGDQVRFVVQGTKSPGNWAGVPWIAMRDPRLTDSVQRGLYAVILFAEDMRAFFLCLGMGVEETPHETSVAWLSEIQANFPPPAGFLRGPMPSEAVAKRGKGADYEKSTVYYKQYDSKVMLTEEEFRADLRSISNLLRVIGDSGKFRIEYQKNARVATNIREIPTAPENPSRPADIQTPKNLILYGPPGTGKTYWLREKFKDYTDTPASVDEETWLQDLMAEYGWRQVIAAALADLGRPSRVPEIRENRWVKAKAKQRRRTTSVNATLWRYLQEHTPESVRAVNVSTRRPPFIFSKDEAGQWSLLPEWIESDDESSDLVRLLAAGPRGSDRPVHRYRVVTFHPSYGYEDFVRGIRPVPDFDDDQVQFRVVDGVFKQICDEARANPAKRYALFIDEINRANIAKVFGELITLIEPDKRAVFAQDGSLITGMTVQLAGGEGEEIVEGPFGVPSNLDLFGTMNTADRSIALLDVALRRRFEFQEMEPDYDTIDKEVDSIHLGDLLRRINDRLEYLLDRDHRIGHAYLMGVGSLLSLRHAFRVQIIPLLQEYFFDDLSKIAGVLSTPKSAPPFIAQRKVGYGELFPGARLEGVLEERSKYLITSDSTWTVDSFRGIYAASDGEIPVQESS